MQEKSPQGGLFLKRWARVLLRPELRHIEPACDALEQALIGRVSDPVPADEDIACSGPQKLLDCTLCICAACHEKTMMQLPNAGTSSCHVLVRRAA